MQQKKQAKHSERGASIVELLIIVVIAGIVTAITVMSLVTPRKQKAEAEALVLTDLMREAQQRALSEKKTMKIQINSASRVIQLINENESTGATDAPTAANDIILKTIPYNSDSVYIGIAPANMSSTPTEVSPVTPITFTSNQAVLRFKPNGTVHNAGNNDVGTGSIPTGRTIYVWTKKLDDYSATPTVADVLRSVTVLGNSGSTKLWKCSTGTGQCTTWTN